MEIIADLRLEGEVHLITRNNEGEFEYTIEDENGIQLMGSSKDRAAICALFFVQVYENELVHIHSESTPASCAVLGAGLHGAHQYMCGKVLYKK